MEGPLSHFRFAQFQFVLKAADCINLPTYKGSTFRGAFGHAFKKVVCVHPVRKSREALNPAETIVKSDAVAGQRGIISNRVNREKICGSCLLNLIMAFKKGYFSQQEYEGDRGRYLEAAKMLRGLERSIEASRKR